MNILKGLMYGYDIISIKPKSGCSGIYIERFINICNANKIRIWNKSGVQAGLVKLVIYHYDFDRIVATCKKCGFEAVIVRECGLPAVIKIAKNNYNILVGVLAAMLTVFVCNLFVWRIDFTGNYRYTDFTLRDILKENMIREGSKKGDIDCLELEYSIRNQHPDISFVSAFIEGSVLKLTIKEGIKYEGEKQNEEQLSIVAAHDGIIKSMVTRSGTPAVKAGDEVKKGDVLVYGYYQIRDDSDTVVSTEKVRADADIKIMGDEEKQFTFPVEYEEYVYTGNKKWAVSIELNNNKKILLKPFKVYESCDIMKCNVQNRLTEFFERLPQTGLTFYYECEKETGTYDSESAKNRAEQILYDYVMQLMHQNIQVNNVNYDIRFEAGNVLVDSKFTMTGSFIEWAEVDTEE